MGISGAATPRSAGPIGSTGLDEAGL